MKLDVPLHVRYQNAEGPIGAYRNAEPWTAEMQDAMRRAFEGAEQISPFFSEVDYHCPACGIAIEEIRYESVVFYGDEDFHRVKPLGEGHLITLAVCGHQYRREIQQ